MEYKEFVLPEDGTSEEHLKAIEKEHEEDVKNKEKAFNDAIKEVEEINGKGQPEPIDKLKPFEEQLILEEPDYVLAEELELAEALPKDLAKAYKTAKHIGDNRWNYQSYGNIRSKGQNTVDFDKSEYRVITPEEAKQLKKDGQASKVHAIFDGQLVAFNNDGKQTYKAERAWDSDRAKYTRNNGDIKDRSNQLTFNTIVDNADKIYYADEKGIDSAQRDQRRANPESKYSHFNHPEGSSVAARALYDRSQEMGPGEARGALRNKSYEMPSLRGYDNVNPDTYYQRRAKEYADQAQRYRDRAANETDPESKAYYEKEAAYAEKNSKEYNDRYTTSVGKAKDYQARLRYSDSEKALQATNNEFLQAKKDQARLERQASKAKDNLEVTKSQGSEASRRNRDKIQQIQARIRELRKELAEYEINLDDSSAGDAEAVAAAENELNNILAQQEATQQALNRLLRR